MTTETVYILGGAQTDFSVKWAAQEEPLFAMLSEAALGALEAAHVEPASVDVAHVGNFAAELFCGQGQLGGFVATLMPELAGLPTARHEAACASGSVATLAATAELEAGRYDVALVVGAEMMRNVPGAQAAAKLASAAWVGREALEARFAWPALFSRMAEVYDARWGLDPAHLCRIAEINFENARRNPNAQTRDWQMPDGAFALDDDQNPLVEGMLRKQDCGRITDGAAAIVLASPRFARDWAKANGTTLEALPRIQGWGHRTAPLMLEDKLAGAENRDYMFPHLRGAIEDCYARAGIEGPGDLDVFETHDCFTITEYLALEHFGIAAPGQAARVVEDGSLEHDGALPVNPSGGLLGLGHPVGATGMRMLLDAANQVTGCAGAYQVDGARRVATLNIGGSCTTAVSFVVGRDA